MKKILTYVFPMAYVFLLIILNLCRSMTKNNYNLFYAYVLIQGLLIFIIGVIIGKWKEYLENIEMKRVLYFYLGFIILSLIIFKDGTILFIYNNFEYLLLTLGVLVTTISISNNRK